MYATQKIQLLQKQWKLKKYMILTISKCLEKAVHEKNIGSLKSELTTAVTRSIKQYESSKKAFELLEINNTFFHLIA